MDIHGTRAGARPLWRRFALDEPAEIDAEVGPETVEALGELESGEPAPDSGAAAGRERAWARLAFALDLRRHAAALKARRASDK